VFPLLLQNLLLRGFDTDVVDFDAKCKVADFGTVRADAGHNDGKIHTSGKTHASTIQVVGTTPYMPSEYTQRGHVSERTDSFALGIVLMEMLADLHPTQARELVDEYPRATVEVYLQDHSGEKSWSDSDAARKAGSILSIVAADCTAAQHTRSTPAAVLPKLEKALEVASGLAWSLLD
jgi:serine/threonine protein kinase